MILFKSIVVVILTVFAAGFAVLNIEPVLVNISPVHDPVALPLYSIALASLMFGFIAGGAMVWMNMNHVRRDRRQQKKHIKTLEKEVNELKEDKFMPEAKTAEILPVLPSQ